MAGYNLFALLALAVGTALLGRGLRQQGLRPLEAWLLGPAIFVVSRAGSHVLFALETGRWRERALSYVDFGVGGMSLFGGLAAASALVVVWARVRRIPLLRLLDALAPATAFAFAIGRWGCLAAGCCRGFRLPDGWRLPAMIPAPGLFPAPLLQSAVEVLIGVAVLRTPRGLAGGRVGCFLALYGTSRFALAFVRTERIVWAGLTTSQLLSIPAFAIGAGLVLAALRRGARRDLEIGHLDGAASPR